jgi:hypothetical protein
MASHEHTDPGIRVLRGDNGQLDAEAIKQVEALERAIVSRVWGKVPGWVKWGLGLLLAGGGSGVAIGQYIPFTFTPPWAKPAELANEVTAREAADAHLQGQIDGLKSGMGQTVYDALQRYDEDKAKAKRRSRGQR